MKSDSNCLLNLTSSHCGTSCTLCKSSSTPFKHFAVWTSLGFNDLNGEKKNWTSGGRPSVMPFRAGLCQRGLENADCILW